MIISIASGKGGTGKTTIATSLALSLDNVQLLDCDVEEPNAHIFIKPVIEKEESVYIPVPEINEEKCRPCRECKNACMYNAIAVLGESVLVFPELCHGCGACAYVCPSKAIKEINMKIGVIEIGRKEQLDFVYGKLDIGKAMAPPVIRAVKEKIDSQKTVIVDAPPGTSCPVIAAMQNSDYCILVTEPTPFGLHDLKLAVEVVEKLSIPCGVVINRSDLGNDETVIFCRKQNIPILMQIPFNKEIAVAYSKGIPIIEAIPKFKEEFQDIFKNIQRSIFDKQENK